MKPKVLYVLFVLSHACAVTSLADPLRCATICAGAARLNNGSIVTIGQPFVGFTAAANGSVTVQAGIIPVLTANSAPGTPAPLSITPTRQFANGSFQMAFPSSLGTTYLVQASTNLINWIPVWTNIANGTSVLFEDPYTTNFSRRFYRVMTQ